MKTTGLTSLFASIALGLSLAAWAAAADCGYAANNPVHDPAAGTCHYVSGQLSGCNADTQFGPGVCASGSTHLCVKSMANFTKTTWNSTGCSNTGSDSGGQKCVAAATKVVKLQRADDSLKPCPIGTEGSNGSLPGGSN